MKRLLLAFLALPSLAHAQAINTPPTVTSFNQLRGSTGAAITGFGTSIGQALGPLVNYTGSGLPGLFVNGRLVFDRMSTTASDYTTLQIGRETAYTGGAPNINQALVVETVSGAAATDSEWNLLGWCKTNSATGQCLGSYMLGERAAGAHAAIWGAVLAAGDDNDQVSSTSGQAIIGTEVDVGANKADDGVNAAIPGGKGQRVGINVVGIRQLGSDTAQTQFAYGLWLTTNTLPNVAAIDAHTNFMSAIGVGINVQSYSVFDSRGAIAPTASVNPVYGLNMDAGQAIEFKGDDTTLLPAPQRTMLYTSGTLAYQVGGVTKWSVSDTGAETAAGGILSSATFNTAIGTAALSATTGSNSTAVGYQAMQNVLGSNNVAVGSGALAGVAGAAASGSTAIGYGALQLVTTAVNNVGVGYQALHAATTGGFNVAVGLNALVLSQTDIQNVAVGYVALSTLNGGGNNVAVGFSAGSHLTTGGSNLILGAGVSSATLSTGSRNILIGTAANCDTAAAGTNDSFAICASSGSTPLISGSLVAATPTLTVNGTLTVAGGLFTAQSGFAGVVRNITVNSYSVVAADYSLLLAPTGALTVTLPAASSNGGRILLLKLTTAFAVTSASANVVPLAGGSASTAILTGTAGKFAMLQSDGTNWQIINAN